MNKQLRYILTLLFFMILSGCDDKGNTDIVNNPPMCEILSPSNLSEYHKGDTIKILANATDKDDDLNNVVFELNGKYADQTSNEPYTFYYLTSDLDTGYYSIKITAYDIADNTDTDEATVHIMSRPIIADSIVDFEKNVYRTVKIGEQWWMAENLRATKYNDSTSLKNVEDNEEWQTLTTSAYCWYNNNEEKYKNPYGALYNFYIVENGNICPDGYRIPSDDDWKQLELYLGINTAYLDSLGFRGTDEAYKLKVTGTEYWGDLNVQATNETGFSAIGSGRREYSGEFRVINDQAYYLSSTMIDSNAYSMRGLMDYGKIYCHRGHRNYGCSIRCMKD